MRVLFGSSSQSKAKKLDRGIVQGRILRVAAGEHPELDWEEGAVFLACSLAHPSISPASFCDHIHAFCWVHRLLVLRNRIFVKLGSKLLIFIEFLLFRNSSKLE